MTNYICGYLTPVFAAWIFQAPAVLWDKCTSTTADTLVFGVRGPCRCNPKTFLGVILSVNGEDSKIDSYTTRTVQIGVGGYNFPYGAVVWMEMGFKQNITFKHRINAVAYANSRCIKEREDMAVKLSKVIEVHAFGRCNANGLIKRPLLKYKNRDWTKNHFLFKHYDYVLAAEHGITPGYVTEKPFMAVAAGAIPIYWGDNYTATKFLNSNRILLWDNSLPNRIAKITSQEKRIMQKLPAVNELKLKQSANRVAKLLNNIRKKGK